MYRTEFRNGAGKTVAVIESENAEFLLAVESRVIGTRVQTEGMDEWIASAAVTQNGALVMEYDEITEPRA